MASKLFAPSLRMSTSASVIPVFRQPMRSFQASSRRLETQSAAIPIRRPIGAFRGGVFGFLLGSSLAGAAVYYYIFDEYKLSNELLTEDIYALQAAVQRLHTYVSSLEEKVDALQKKKS